MVYNNSSNKNGNASVWSVEWKHPVQSSTSHSALLRRGFAKPFAQVPISFTFFLRADEMKEIANKTGKCDFRTAIIIIGPVARAGFWEFLELSKSLVVLHRSTVAQDLNSNQRAVPLTSIKVRRKETGSPTTTSDWVIIMLMNCCTWSTSPQEDEAKGSNAFSNSRNSQRRLRTSAGRQTGTLSWWKMKKMLKCFRAGRGWGYEEIWDAFGMEGYI